MICAHRADSLQKDSEFDQLTQAPIEPLQLLLRPEHTDRMREAKGAAWMLLNLPQ
jgi:hypothetical protein